MNTKSGLPAQPIFRLLAGVLLVMAGLAYSGGAFSAPGSHLLSVADASDLVDIRVNQMTRAEQHEPTLAVDPSNPGNILAAAKDWRTGPKQVWHYRSTDGGATWTDGYGNLLPS